MRDHVQAAKMIRQELKKAFIGVKFSVTSQSYSMGNTVYVDWENGPTREQVRTITGKYQYGEFNMMDDCYDSTNKRKDIPQAMFVNEQRRVSNEG